LEDGSVEAGSEDCFFVIVPNFEQSNPFRKYHLSNSLVQTLEFNPQCQQIQRKFQSHQYDQVPYLRLLGLHLLSDWLDRSGKQIANMFEK
jgi:hypothetical protein